MRILFPLCFLVFLLACESKQEEAGNLHYELVLADSIQFQGLYEMPSIVAIHPQTDELMVLAYQGGDSFILILAPDGSINHEFKYPKEGPLSVGESLMSSTFFRDGYALMGRAAIGIYNKQFEITQRIAIPLAMPMITFNHTQHLQSIQNNGKEQLLFHFSPDGNYTLKDIEYYQNYNPLTLLDVEEEDFQAYGAFHEASLYRQGSTGSIIRPLFSVHNNETYLTYSSDTVAYVFDETGNELQRTKIPFDKFVHHVAIPEDAPATGTYALGRIMSYLHYDGLDIWEYFPGLTVSDRSNMTEDGPNPNKKRFLISKNGIPMMAPFELPERVSYLSLVDQYGYVWAAQNVYALDEEPEGVTLYKLKIQSK